MGNDPVSRVVSFSPILYIFVDLIIFDYSRPLGRFDELHFTNKEWSVYYPANIGQYVQGSLTLGTTVSFVGAKYVVVHTNNGYGPYVLMGKSPVCLNVDECASYSEMIIALWESLFYHPDVRKYMKVHCRGRTTNGGGIHLPVFIPSVWELGKSDTAYERVPFEYFDGHPERIANITTKSFVTSTLVGNGSRWACVPTTSPYFFNFNDSNTTHSGLLYCISIKKI